MVREQLKKPIYLGTIILVLVSALFILQQNYEFLFYVAVLVVLGAVILVSDKHVEYPQWVVWLLFIWGLLHMAGGAVVINGSVLYAQMLLPLIAEPYNILKYDQFVHAYGFFVATITMYYVLKDHLAPSPGAFAIGLTLFCAGLGLSALNEIIEFIAVVLMPSTNVGGYINTALDLCFNAIGAGIAIVWLRAKKLL